MGTTEDLFSDYQNSLSEAGGGWFGYLWFPPKHKEVSLDIVIILLEGGQRQGDSCNFSDNQSR